MNKVILFDLDDTLINTHIIFTNEILKIKKLVSKISEIDITNVSDFLDSTIIDTYQIAKVNPDKIWLLTTNKLAKKYNLNIDIQNKILKIFFGIYKIKPKIKKGAKKILTTLEKEYALGLVNTCTVEMD